MDRSGSVDWQRISISGALYDANLAFHLTCHRGVRISESKIELLLIRAEELSGGLTQFEGLRYDSSGCSMRLACLTSCFESAQRLAIERGLYNPKRRSRSPYRTSP